MCDHSRSFLQFCLEALFCIGLSWVSKDFIHYMKKLDLGLSTHWFRNLCLLAAKDKIKLINVLNKTCVWIKRLFKQYQESFKGLKLAMNQWQLSPKALPSAACSFSRRRQICCSSILSSYIWSGIDKDIDFISFWIIIQQIFYGICFLKRIPQQSSYQPGLKKERNVTFFDILTQWMEQRNLWILVLVKLQRQNYNHLRYQLLYYFSQNIKIVKSLMTDNLISFH